MNFVNQFAAEMKDFLDLKLEIQAVKFISDEAELPEHAIRAAEQLGHLALCQALALAKRQGKTVYTAKDAEWCWSPLVALGYVDCAPGSAAFETIVKFLGIADAAAGEAFFAAFPRLPLGKYRGVLIGPASSADFAPDVLLLNCDNNFQLRTLIWAIKHKTGKMLDVSLDPIDSCVFTLVKSMLTGDYTVAIPDPGDQERALSDKNEIILGVPVAKAAELLEGCRFLRGRSLGYKDMQMQMQFDFARPPFYNELFSLWGLGQGRLWDRGAGK